MRKFCSAAVGLALALGLALVSPGTALAQGAGAQGVLCGKSLQFSLAATSTTQIVPAVQGQSIHICGVVLNTGAAAATYQLTIGTGTNCNTNTVQVTPAFSLPANGSMVVATPGLYAWFSTPSPPAGTSGYQLCHTSTGTGPMNVIVQYHQS